MKPISRKTFIKGLGVTLALPYLEAMMPLSVLAQSNQKYITRMAFLFVPNGVNIGEWTPKTEGKLELSPILSPLEKVKDSILVISGLTQDKARPNGDGAGDHARSASAWLTGCQPKKTSGADIKVGISADQLTAQKIGNLTKFPSLEIGCEKGAQAGNCDSGYSCAYSSSISWRSESTPVAKEIDPKLLFERLFNSDNINETKESQEKRQRYNQSILDFVKEDANQLKKQLGTRDKQKLEEYFSGIREIENRLAQHNNGKEIVIGNKVIPDDFNKSYSEHIKLMGDMMIMAFQADLTRVCTFMFANEGSNRSYRNTEIAIAEGHHDLSHHGGDIEKLRKIKEINKFHITQVAYMLEKMNSIKEGDSTLLNNTMLIYGGGISDGNQHNHNNLPIFLAGKGGNTIKTNQHLIVPKETPMNNLLLSLLDRMGVHAETLGDSTGRLNQLF